jgi:tetratricopeptide (TPR) repeat protein
MFRYFLFVIAIIAAPFTATAEGLPFRATKEEATMLPEWCRYKIGEEEKKDPARQQMWESKLGHDNWVNFHHYCDQLNFFKRVERGAYKDKGEALNRLDFSIRAMKGSIEGELKPNIPIRAELYYQLGRAMLLQTRLTKRGGAGEAMGAFLNAINFQPDYAPPYVEIADFYISNGQKDKALDILSKGLKMAPADKMLRRRMAKLGGQLPDLPEQQPSPSGLVDTPVKDKQPTQPKKDELKKPLAEAQSSTTGITPPKKPIPNQTGSFPAANPEPAQKLGNSKNPWCRFCPEPTPVQEAKP